MATTICPVLWEFLELIFVMIGVATLLFAQAVIRRVDFVESKIVELQF